MTTELLDCIANCAAGFDVAWGHLHDRIPSLNYDKGRVSGSVMAAPPHRDPEVLDLYLLAQAAVRHCYFRIVAAGAPQFWPSANVRPDVPVHPLALVAVLSRIRGFIDLIDEHARGDLAAAEKKLKPFWMEPPPPRLCRACKEQPAAEGRRYCWTCASKRRTKRQVRIR